MLKSLLSRKILLLIGDMVLIYAALLGTIFLRFSQSFKTIFNEHLLPFTILYLLWIIIFYIFDLYNLNLIKRRFNFYPRIIGALIINLALGLGFFYLFPFFGISPKTNLMLILVISGLLFILWRLGFWALFSSYFLNQVLVLGQGKEIDNLKSQIRRRPYLGYQLIDRDPDKELMKQIHDQKINTVIFSEELETDTKLLKTMYLSIPERVNFLDFSQAYELICQKISLSTIQQTGFLERFKKGEKKGLYDKQKRIIDIVLGFFIFIASLPVWLIIALAIKLEDAGPVFYKQKRVGQNQKTFLLIKFRSMNEEAEKQGAKWADKKDSRVTKIGRFLRRTHLDELPQMLNVLTGDLSLVGPRPERPIFVQDLAKKIPHYHVRHLIKPGFTGWAQIKFRYARSLMDSAEKLQYDLYYLKNRGLLFDLGILLKTVQLIFRKEK